MVAGSVAFEFEETIAARIVFNSALNDAPD
jgi:hypothetical protein